MHPTAHYPSTESTASSSETPDLRSPSHSPTMFKVTQEWLNLDPASTTYPLTHSSSLMDPVDTALDTLSTTTALASPAAHLPLSTTESPASPAPPDKPGTEQAASLSQSPLPPPLPPLLLPTPLPPSQSPAQLELIGMVSNFDACLA